jgi:hypothetical protein
MSHEHLSARMIEGLAAGEARPEDLVLLALRHLGGERAACPTCQGTLRPYPLGRFAERAGGAYTEALARAAGRAEKPEAEYRAAEALVEELAGERNLGRAVGLIASSPRFAALGLGLALVDLAAATVVEEPEVATGLALLAILVAERIDRHRYPGTFADDLMTAASAQRADALRALGELEEAEEELARADEARRRGSGERFYEAEVELVRCRLLLAQGGLEEARERSRRVERWASRLEAGYAWDARLVRAQAARVEGEPARAAEELLDLAAAMRGKASSAKEGRVRLELVAALAEAEEFEVAWAELAKIRLLPEGQPSPRFRARREFWSGVVLRGLGRLEEAAESLEGAGRALVAEGLGLEAVQAALHLLDLHQEAGREDALARRLEELPDLLTARGLPEWAAAYLVSIVYDLGGGQVDGDLLRLARLTFDEFVAIGMVKEPEAVQ